LEVRIPDFDDRPRASLEAKAEAEKAVVLGSPK